MSVFGTYEVRGAEIGSTSRLFNRDLETSAASSVGNAIVCIRNTCRMMARYGELKIMLVLLHNGKEFTFAEACLYTILQFRV